MFIYMSLIDGKDKGKFEKIYLKHRDIMLYVAIKILKDEYLAEDAVHKAFLKVIDNLYKIDENDCRKTRGFLVIIVRNISIDIFNQRKNEGTISIHALEEFVSYGNSGMDGIINENELINKILKMPIIYSHTLMLKYIYGYSNSEISTILDITETNIRKRIERGRNILLTEIRKDSGFNE